MIQLFRAIFRRPERHRPTPNDNVRAAMHEASGAIAQHRESLPAKLAAARAVFEREGRKGN